MAMMPKRSKFRKVHRGRLKGTSQRAATKLSFGDFGLHGDGLVAGSPAAKSKPAVLLPTAPTAGQAKIWIRIFPHKPISSKPAETRMGKGKGDVEFWAAAVKPGTDALRAGWRVRKIRRSSPSSVLLTRCPSRSR